MWRVGRRLAVAVCALALVAAACGEEGTSGDAVEDQVVPPGDVAVSAVDDGEGGGYAFELAETVPAGATRIELTNDGSEPHHAQLFRLNDDATMDDLGQQLATGDPAALTEVGRFDGGTGTTDPGATSSAAAVADLTEGTYVFMCFIENAEGVPHLAAGMVTPFEVATADDPGEVPEEDGQVSLQDVGDNYGFSLPDDISGDDELLVTNTSEAEPHEMNILALNDEASAADVLGFFSSEGPPEGPPPFSSVGGMQGLSPGGGSQVLSLDLEPGRYVFICFIPSAADGAPHATKGMIEEVDIA